MARKKRDLFETRHDLVSRCEQSVRKAQWQIYQARLEDKISRLHILQERLCESFCAKLLATEYAIINLGLNRAQTQSLSNPEHCLWPSKSQIQKESQAKRSHNRLASPIFDTLENAQSKKAARFAESGCVQGRRQVKSTPFVPENWKISIAQSIWPSKRQKVSNSNGIHQLSSGSKNDVTNNFLQGKTKTVKKSFSFLKRQARVTNTQQLLTLEQSVKHSVREQARQIHAFLALEPEWQAVFVLPQDKQYKRPISAPYQETVSLRGENSLSSQIPSQANVVVDPVFEGKKGVQVKKNFKTFKPSFSTRRNSFEGGNSSGYEKIVKQVTEYLDSPFPQYVLTGSVNARLHTVNYELLLEKLNTFPAMKKHIELWLKADILRTGNTANQACGIISKSKQDVSFQRNKSRSSTMHHDTFWCLSRSVQSLSQFISRASTTSEACGTDNSLLYSTKKDDLFSNPIKKRGSPSVNPVLQKGGDLPWLSTKYSLHSCFPQTVWQEQKVIMHDLNQIENSSVDEDNTIAGLLLRIMLDDFLKKVQRSAKAFLSYKRSNGLGSQKNVTPVSLERSRKAQKGLFCANSLTEFVIIHHDKRLLEMCISQAQDELPEIEICTRHGPAARSNRQVTNQSQVLLSVSKRVINSGKRVSSVETNDTCLPWNRKDVFRFYDDKDKSNLQASFNDKQKLWYSKVKDCRQGFTWLGFQFIQVNRQSGSSYLCKATPSQGSVRTLLLMIKARAKQSQSASTNVLIARLNPLINRWLGYYQHCEYKRSYDKVSYLIWQKTRAWVSRR